MKTLEERRAFRAIRDKIDTTDDISAVVESEEGDDLPDAESDEPAKAATPPKTGKPMKPTTDENAGWKPNA